MQTKQNKTKQNKTKQNKTVFSSALSRLAPAIVGIFAATTPLACGTDVASDTSVNCGDNAMECIPCKAGEMKCDGATLRKCNDNGQGLAPLSVCASEALCLKGLSAGACAAVFCTPADAKCLANKMQLCAPGQDQYVTTDCPTKASCISGLTSGKCGGGEGECTVVADCGEPASECQKKTCAEGACGTENLSAGAIASAQVEGDCKRSICDGKGGVTTEPQETDKPNDKNDCTLDNCSGSAPNYTWAAPGTVCNGTGFCNGSGQCGTCAPGGTKCVGPGSVQTCQADGTWNVASLCKDQTCVNGACQGVCGLGQARCTGNSVQTCQSEGTWGGSQDCVGQSCSNGQCTGSCAPGATKCQGNGVTACQTNGTWGSVSACTGKACVSGACVGICEPSTTQCSGNSVQTCQVEGTWSSAVSCGLQACVNGQCVGLCSPGTTQCSGNGVQTCQTDGKWGAASACTGKACVSGACVGICEPSTTQCSGNGVQTCQVAGSWSSAASCTNQACVNGQCVGLCVPGTTQCSGNGVQTCASDGKWGAASACTGKACVSGACVGICEPTTTQCAGNAVQTCQATGAWSLAVSCGAQACVSGQCVGSCTPGNTQCSGNAIQTCQSAGYWTLTTQCINQACVSSKCTGVCEPARTQCTSLTMQQTCQTTGLWATALACVNQTCVNGGCTGVCAQGQTTCSGNTPKTCQTDGSWVGVTACTNKACVAGACVGVCEPGTYRCSATGREQCSAIGTWVAGAACGATTPSCWNGQCYAGSRSCAGLSTTACGGKSCCDQPLVPGGTFPMGRGSGADACPSGMTCQASELPEHTATLDSFYLDTYEVTVGRFRRFVQNYTGTPPLDGAGNHHNLGAGWQSAWNPSLPTSQVALNSAVISCSGTTWSTAEGANETKPINCVTWFEAMAFCIWDGGRFPTEAEWEYAAAGGSENRLYPWGSAVADATRAVYAPLQAPSAVGSLTSGAGKWGHQDLAGNIWEWVLDEYDASWYAGTGNNCVNCAKVGNSTSVRVIRGGGINVSADSLRAASRYNYGSPTSRYFIIGFRCARTP